MIIIVIIKAYGIAAMHGTHFLDLNDSKPFSIAQCYSYILSFLDDLFIIIICAKDNLFICIVIRENIIFSSLSVRCHDLSLYLFIFVSVVGTVMKVYIFI